MEQSLRELLDRQARARNEIRMRLDEGKKTGEGVDTVQVAAFDRSIELGKGKRLLSWLLSMSFDWWASMISPKNHLMPLALINDRQASRVRRRLYYTSPSLLFSLSKCHNRQINISQLVGFGTEIHLIISHCISTEVYSCSFVPPNATPSLIVSLSIVVWGLTVDWHQLSTAKASSRVLFRIFRGSWCISV